MNIFKKYKLIRLNAKLRNVEALQSKTKAHLMKIVRNHCTTDDIKDTFQILCTEFNFKKQHSGFYLPSVVCRSENSSNYVGKYFDITRYAAEKSNEFKRNTAEYFVEKVQNTTRNILLNYPLFKHFELQGKKKS